MFQIVGLIKAKNIGKVNAAVFSFFYVGVSCGYNKK